MFVLLYQWECVTLHCTHNKRVAFATSNNTHDATVHSHTQANACSQLFICALSELKCVISCFLMTCMYFVHVYVWVVTPVLLYYRPKISHIIFLV